MRNGYEPAHLSALSQIKRQREAVVAEGWGDWGDGVGWVYISEKDSKETSAHNVSLMLSLSHDLVWRFVTETE